MLACNYPKTATNLTYISTYLLRPYPEYDFVVGGGSIGANPKRELALVSLDVLRHSDLVHLQNTKACV